MPDPFDAMLANSTKSSRRRVTAAPTAPTKPGPPEEPATDNAAAADPAPASAKAVILRRSSVRARPAAPAHPPMLPPAAGSTPTSPAVSVPTPAAPPADPAVTPATAPTVDADLERALAAAAAVVAEDVEPDHHPGRRWPRAKSKTAVAGPLPQVADPTPEAINERPFDVDAPPTPTRTKPDRAAAKAGKRQQRQQAKTARVDFASALGGSRGIQRAVRWAVGLVALVLLLVGAITIGRPTVTPISAADVDRAVSSQLSGSGFPIQPAEAFAARFASAYYTWASTDPQGQRAGILAAYLPSTVADGWDGHGAQKVVAGPYVSQTTVSSDGRTAIVHLSLQLDSGAWLFPDVPVYSDGASGLVIAATPTLGTPPGRAAYPGTSGSLPTGGGNDDAESADRAAVGQVLTGFLPAWAASDSAALDRYLTQDAAAPARAGLGGAVTFKAVSGLELSAPAPGQTTRQVTATVTWTVTSSQPTTAGSSTGAAQPPPDPSSVTQTYLITVVQAQGLWSVKNIAPGSTEVDADNNTAGGGSGPVTITPGGQPAIVIPTAAATPARQPASAASSASPTSAPQTGTPAAAPIKPAAPPASDTAPKNPTPTTTSAPGSSPARSTSR